LLICDGGKVGQGKKFKVVIMEEQTSLCIGKKLNVLLSFLKNMECVIVINKGHAFEVV
jgi:hypothetical protein